ncbi:NADP-dependent 3-hydroxy acid dehydrogenase YdfG [Nocardioides thalensis]|uniref:NADP-dependent 3-hydroxy acid dehydrogenase YdfG n=1 Tax=Nocardioides thalensis TaxID=1914755 RepID=A0A853C4Z7_9ACTN|nr:SDR family oxidoreductase [Nocardioides thalensis]NYJ01752.1 NADP-dependent 3-hydroxy acid dehydrogenase YdfG [Nocardioides thalensis]
MSRFTPIDLDGALVVITGAARGIGLATAREFAAAGAQVAIGDLDLELAQEAAADLGPQVSAYLLDVTDATSFETFVAAAEEHHGSPVDVLVNNAGIMPNGAFLEGTERIDRMTMDVNVHGVINGMRIVLPGMVERGRGHVVNVASLAGKFPLKGLAVYNASKFAAVGLTAATRLEMGGTGVSVTAVLPSAVRTELSSGIDLGVLPTVDPEDIARAVVGSVRTRAAEIAVPSYVGLATKTVPFVPERVLNVLRRLTHDDAAITRVDEPVRRRYLDRIENKSETAN